MPRLPHNLRADKATQTLTLMSPYSPGLLANGPWVTPTEVEIISDEISAVLNERSRDSPPCISRYNRHTHSSGTQSVWADPGEPDVSQSKSVCDRKAWAPET